jgi:hypothetical protein
MIVVAFEGGVSRTRHTSGQMTIKWLQQIHPTVSPNAMRIALRHMHGSSS